MEFIGTVIEKLQRHPKRIVFPEGTEPRILQAARQFHCLQLGAPIILGERPKVELVARENNVPLDGIRILDPAQSQDLDKFARAFRLLSRPRLKVMEARDAMMMNPNYFGAMMVAMRQADGIVTGTHAATATVLRPLFQTIGLAPNITTACSCTVMEFDDHRLGDNGVMLLADCGVVPDPTMEQLADIAVSAAKFARHLMGLKPRVAFLSFATRDPAMPPSIGKVQAAVALAARKSAEQGLEAEFDGELQGDTAVVPRIAQCKLPDSKVAGQANVLIFPDLQSGNIASRLLISLSKVQAYGHILLGLDQPAADVSRGSTARDILGVASIVGLQAIAYDSLYPGRSGPGTGS
jgi:phosphate acetyltransferase